MGGPCWAPAKPLTVAMRPGTVLAGRPSTFRGGHLTDGAAHTVRPPLRRCRAPRDARWPDLDAGYLLTGTERGDIVRAVLAVAGGDAVHGGPVARRVVDSLTGTASRPYPSRR
jgi:hypothetical protein